MVLDPGGELVELAIDRIEQDHAADAIADAADLEAPGGRQEAAAIADDDDRHLLEFFGAVGIAIEAGEVASRLVHEALEAAGLPELAGGGVGGIDSHLRGKKDGVDAGIG